MSYRRLGRTGLQVSAISLGTVGLGLDYGIPVEGMHVRPSPEEAGRLLNRALDLGINFVDTARAYGESEAIIGRTLKARRQEYILATKVAHRAEQGLTGRALRRWVHASVGASLRALHTDVIDLLQIHNVTVDVIRRGEMLDILQDIRRAGHSRFTGVTSYEETATLAALEDGGYDCVQIAYNLLDRQPEERLLPQAQQLDIGVIARSVLLKGALTHRHTYLPVELSTLKGAVQDLQALVTPDAPSLPEMAYRFVLANPAVSTALVGTGCLGELEAAVLYAQRGPLSSALQAGIRQIVVCDRDQLNPSAWPIQEEAWTRNDVARRSSGERPEGTRTW